jgi:hypothetical protein
MCCRQGRGGIQDRTIYEDSIFAKVSGFFFQSGFLYRFVAVATSLFPPACTTTSLIIVPDSHGIKPDGQARLPDVYQPLPEYV